MKREKKEGEPKLGEKSFYGSAGSALVAQAIIIQPSNLRHKFTAVAALP